MSKAYSHTIEMDTCYPPHHTTLVHTNFELVNDEVCFLNIVSEVPLSDEDLAQLSEWIMDDKEEWK